MDRYITGAGYRLSIISDCILRVEINKRNHFTDLSTQRVLTRNFAEPQITINETAGKILINTGRAGFTFSKKRRRVIRIKLNDGIEITNFNRGNLKGTSRTLDGTNGKIPLENGLMSRNGISILDDSNSLFPGEGKEMQRRQSTGRDLYYFAYGRDYRGCIRDFYRMCGKVPLIPRFALGNWWSRYKPYTQNEYIELMQRFIAEAIPITVAAVDIDWHWVNVKEKFGKEFSSGWTGYSWNTDLFPDYRAFLKWLKDNNFKAALNLHPADGVRTFENMYDEMAEEMGVTDKENIKFDIADPQFVSAYFKILHHPYEKDGVDFWWIDWQQGRKSNLKGLDPLWALNYFHYHDNKKQNKRPLILSRYAGLGSHRFPLGFSGDTAVSWKAMRFQPFFTANATNAGYTWWSHDIGGHHKGRKDDELHLRWIQFGVFSPIMRLHSTLNEFMGKEPWKFRYDVQRLTKKFLRLRHELIPYIYSMNYRTHKYGIALVEPMYYRYPDAEEAYTVKNQYFFGSELIAAPITGKINRKTNMAETKVWLPGGRYTDIFNGYIYEGGKYIGMHRGVESIPVLAGEGAIIPMSSSGSTNDWRNPSEMTIRIYRGNNSFILYEDDGDDNTFEDGVFSTTKMSVNENGNEIVFVIDKTCGDFSHLPSRRNYKLQFEDIAGCASIDVRTGDGQKDFRIIEKENGTVGIYIDDVAPHDTVRVTLANCTVLKNADIRHQLIDLISRFQCSVFYKKARFTGFINNPSRGIKCRRIFKGPINELLNLKR